MLDTINFSFAATYFTYFFPTSFYDQQIVKALGYENTVYINEDSLTAQSGELANFVVEKTDDYYAFIMYDNTWNSTVEEKFYVNDNGSLIKIELHNKQTYDISEMAGEGVTQIGEYTVTLDINVTDSGSVSVEDGYKLSYTYLYYQIDAEGQIVNSSNSTPTILIVEGFIGMEEPKGYLVSAAIMTSAQTYNVTVQGLPTEMENLITAINEANINSVIEQNSYDFSR